ncbi:cytochrome c oxidase, cbb3-type, subunit I [Loktanella fryxellensis]|uniref:Cytochrome c oxidase, cbb3-type, subunit I n=1 Tax=Loktanella fryxellensis TaxID=245187 RepID=A0A1H8HIK7_9RHOB|nr:cbb3-type cytochrome c oxidase subunit I [Loktanella fryxellensis]SEN56041.1 cytochrome c oxidase, cbb3-type, subunit I [Loktanella fryxellensis]
MVTNLTSTERARGLAIAGAGVLTGLAIALVGRDDPMAMHGWIILLFCGVLSFVIGDTLFDAEPVEDRSLSYSDDPSKVGILLALVWAVVGMGMGVWVASQSTRPDLRFDAAWSGFGRTRQLHTSGVIFGFGGIALIATSYHIMQRTSRARMPDQVSPWFVVLGFIRFCAVAASGCPIGVTQSKEYAESEWYAVLWLVIVWVVHFVLYISTLAHRNEPHVHVASWSDLSFILVVAILHIVNNRAIPASLTGAKSYCAVSGVQDAMVQWWSGHSAVAFFLTTGFVGMLYYFLPKRAGRPI